MKAAGVINIFKRSVETKKLGYTRYLGEGERKSFKDIVESNIYPGHEVENVLGMYWNVLDMSKREWVIVYEHISQIINQPFSQTITVRSWSTYQQSDEHFTKLLRNGYPFQCGKLVSDEERYSCHYSPLLRVSCQSRW